MESDFWKANQQIVPIKIKKKFIMYINQTVRILNVNILSTTQNELLHNLKKGVLITPNLDHLVKLQHDKEFYKLYQKAEWVVCDSKIL